MTREQLIAELDALMKMPEGGAIGIRDITDLFEFHLLKMFYIWYRLKPMLDAAEKAGTDEKEGS